MGDAIKWLVIGVVALVVVMWLRNGFNVSAQPNGWGSGMLYGNGSSWMNLFSPFQPNPNAHLFSASYGSGNGGFSVQGW
jgi:hypothetical protein